MKKYVVSLFMVFCLIMAFTADAKADYSTDLVFSGYIQEGSGDIDAGYFSVPVVYDWNSDGKKDLIVGSRVGTAQTGYHGYVNFYENIGTNSSPVFGSSSYMEACTMTCSPIDVSGGTGG